MAWVPKNTGDNAPGKSRKLKADEKFQSLRKTGIIIDHNNHQMQATLVSSIINQKFFMIFVYLSL